MFFSTYLKFLGPLNGQLKLSRIKYLKIIQKSPNFKDKLAESASAATKFRERIADVSNAGDIPSANAIHEARKKREELRKLAEDPSYVSMSKKKQQIKPKRGSRIAGVDSDSDEEQITRLNVVNKKRAAIDDDIDRGREQDDDGVRAWESNLIKGQAIPGQNSLEMNNLLEQQRGKDERPVDVRIREKLGDLKERLKECHMNKKRIDSEMAEPEGEDAFDAEEVNERYTYFAELQSWLKDYTHFINSKHADIDDYVRAVREYKAERASVQLRKRQLDVKDAGLQFTFTAPKGGNMNMAPDVKSRIREREGRRTRRKLDRQKQGIKQHHIGDSSDDEMDTEQCAAFEVKREALEAKRLALFDDVVEEYVDCRQVLNRFNQFRDVYHKWYKVCFIEECAGAVLLPLLKGFYYHLRHEFHWNKK